MMPPPEPPGLCHSRGSVVRNNHASTEVLSVCSQPKPEPRGQARQPDSGLGGTWHHWPKQGRKGTRSLWRSWPNPDMASSPSTARAEAHFSAGLGFGGQGQLGGTMPWPGRP